MSAVKMSPVRAMVMMRINNDDVCTTKVMAGADGGASADKKLALLVAWAGSMSDEANKLEWRRSCLLRIYGLCFGWLAALGETKAFYKIAAERLRQEELFHNGKHLFTCASPVADHYRKLRVLVEDIGEVAEAIDKLEWAESRGASSDSSIWRTELKTELIQVAAVAVAWLESLEPKEAK